ncbi:hypothetical protein Lsan_1282 [Legionella santicrucis]|uniref:Uncharacterized protein n=1 Tax=Legionella santicrucis TaxID=45074 RepID=A0A0W0Z3X8_9GAMM|nr:hypothetical protein Lsan_1282 [Legionella santicrucis]
MMSITTIPFFISVAIIVILLFSLYITIKYRNPEQYQNTRINVFFFKFSLCSDYFCWV